MSRHLRRLPIREDTWKQKRNEECNERTVRQLRKSMRFRERQLSKMPRLRYLKRRRLKSRKLYLLWTASDIDIPLVRFRDKGTPADNLSNYDSAQERMLYVAPLASVKENTLLFVTAASMCKLVSGAEFDVGKKENDRVYETC